MSIKTLAVPTKPWKASKRERAIDIGILLTSILSSYSVVALTPMKGKLAYFAIYFLSFAILT